jgi:hypothetical protein
MTRAGTIAIGLVALLATAAAPPPSSVTAGGVTLRSVEVQLPASDRVFPAPADAMNAHCTTCHSPGMVLTQPALTPTAWQDEIAKMRNAYKAPVADADVAAILGYLTALKVTP